MQKEHMLELGRQCLGFLDRGLWSMYNPKHQFSTKTPGGFFLNTLYKVKVIKVRDLADHNFQTNTEHDVYTRSLARDGTAKVC